MLYTIKSETVMALLATLVTLIGTFMFVLGLQNMGWKSDTNPYPTRTNLATVAGLVGISMISISLFLIP